MRTIESRQNPLLKTIRSLGEKKNRRETGLFLLEGKRILETALQLNAPLKHLLVGENCSDKQLVKALAPLAEEVYQAPGELLEYASGVKTSQGILATSPLPQPLKPETIRPQGIYLLLENISDPGNLGTVIRLCWGAGVSGLMLAGNCVDIYDPKVVRSTAGGILKVPVYHFPEGKAALDLCLKKGVKPYLTCCREAQPYHLVKYETPLVLCFGSEAHGLTPELLKAVDHAEKITIPLEPGVDSLNLATSCAVILYRTKFPD